MNVWIKIALFSAFILGIAALLYGLRTYQKHAAELQKLSDLAVRIRTKADKGDAAAEYKLARMFYEGRGVKRDITASVLWFRKAADQGYAKAEFSLGDLYCRGEGVPKDDSEALHWIQKAADQGDPYGESALGYSYLNAEGVPQDDVQALTWYRKAAEQSYPLAQQALGWMYFNGRGAVKDYTQAAGWYQKAAEQGDAISQATLGYMYAYGLGVEKDSIGALRWYRMAAAQGEPSAVRFLKSFRPTRTRRYIELGLAVPSFVMGILCLPALEFLLPGRKLQTWRQPFVTLLGATFLGLASLSAYASLHIIRYLPFHNTFVLIRRVLVAIAVLIVATVVLPAKKRTAKSSPAGAEHN